jgi:hypothetical protein
MPVEVIPPDAPVEATTVSAAALPLAFAALVSTEKAEQKDRKQDPRRRGRIDQSRPSLGRWCKIE